MTGFSDGVVRHDEKSEVLGVRCSQLAGLTGFEQKSVSDLNGFLTILMADETFPAGDVVEFPLRAVGVERAEFLAGSYATDLYVKRLALIQIGRGFTATEGEGQTLKNSPIVALE